VGIMANSNRNPEIVYLSPLGASEAHKNAAVLLPLLGRIDPKIATMRYLLAARKPDDTPLHAKWQHSAVLRRPNSPPIGVMLGYERAANPGDPLYEVPELHLGALALAESEQGQGFATRMLRSFTDHAVQQRHFSAIPGEIEHIGLTVSEENTRAQRLYEGFGLTVVGSDTREGQLMNIMRGSIPDIVQSPQYQYALNL
jgi:ribosomal protein S18 acetylase RimI-like enzyme